MTSAVYRGRKALNQTNKQIKNFVFYFTFLHSILCAYTLSILFSNTLVLLIIKIVFSPKSLKQYKHILVISGFGILCVRGIDA